MATAMTSASLLSRRDPTTHERRVRWRRVLLACGCAYPAVYVITNDVIAASLYDRYNRMDQVISELSANGASTRPFLAAMLPIYTGLLVAFGAGVWKSAGANRALRATAAVLIAWGVTGLLWLPFPMTGRADMTPGPMSANDIGHLVLSGLTGITVIAICGFGAAAFGKRFRVYSLATMAATLIFTGLLTGALSPNMAEGKPTPWLGLYERIGRGAWMSWMAVLAVTLLRRRQERYTTPTDGSPLKRPLARDVVAAARQTRPSSEIE